MKDIFTERSVVESQLDLLNTLFSGQPVTINGLRYRYALEGEPLSEEKGKVTLAECTGIYFRHTVSSVSSKWVLVYVCIEAFDILHRALVEATYADVPA